MFKKLLPILLVRILGRLEKGTKLQLLLLNLLNVLLGFFDLAGVISLGIAFSSLGASNVSSANFSIIDLFRNNFSIFQSMTPEQFSLTWCVICLFMFTIRGILSPLLLKSIFMRLSRYSTHKSNNILRNILQSDINFVNGRNTQELIVATGDGSTSAFNLIPSQVMIIFSELFLLFIFVVTLFVISPPLTIGCIVYFLILFFLLQKKLGKNQSTLSKLRNDALIESSTLVKDTINSWREISLTQTREHFLRRYLSSRSVENSCASELQYLNLLPKFYMELALVFGLFASIIVLNVAGFTESSAAKLGIFVAALMRLLPSFVRIQGAISGINGNSGQAILCLNLMDDLDSSSLLKSIKSGGDINEKIGEILVEDLSLRYPGNESYALNSLSFKVDSFSTLGIAGPSGSGKSSLLDTLIGAQKRFDGSISIEGLSPSDFIQKNPNAIALVPQEIPILKGTILDNIVFGRENDLKLMDNLQSVLERAQLDEFLYALPNGLNTVVGENGANLSGGQKQRLGIARALFGNPRFLFLDEATSSLDASTEEAFTKSLEILHREITIIIIAHRLATIKSCDKIIYIENGIIQSEGSFDFVRQNVPNFEIQANLLGM